MKRTILLRVALLFALPQCSFAGEFRDKGEVIAVDFRSGWHAGRSDDPAVTLKLEKGGYFFEFVRQESELGDYYLRARVKEQVDSLRFRGKNISTEVKSVSLHGASNAYYVNYESRGADAYIAFFTYNGASYAVSASGMGEGDFRGVLASVRKPGEKVEPSRTKKRKIPLRNVAGEQEEDFATQIFKDGEADVPAAATGISSSIFTEAFAPSAESPAEARPATASAAGVGGFMAGLVEDGGPSGQPPYLPRRPLPLILWGVLAGV